MITQKEGVTCIFNEEKELVSIIYKDPKSRHNVFYACTPMSMEELEEMVKSDKVKTKKGGTVEIEIAGNGLTRSVSAVPGNAGSWGK